MSVETLILHRSTVFYVGNYMTDYELADRILVVFVKFIGWVIVDLWLNWI